MPAPILGARILCGVRWTQDKVPPKQVRVMGQEPKNPNIELGGKVQASWSADLQSYVVTFTGAVVRPHVNAVCSSNLNGVPADSRSTIIAAYIAQ